MNASGVLSPTSTPEIFSFEDIQETPKVSVEMRNRILNFNLQKNKSRDKMVFEAISAIEGGGKGASFPAITKWILATYAIPDSNRLKVSVKKVLLKSVEDGTLVRSQKSKRALGIAGSFEFPKEKVKNMSQGPKKTKLKSESPEDNEGKIVDDQDKVKRTRVQKTGNEKIEVH